MDVLITKPGCLGLCGSLSLIRSRYSRDSGKLGAEGGGNPPPGITGAILYLIIAEATSFRNLAPSSE